MHPSYYPALLGALQSLAIVAGIVAFGFAWVWAEPPAPAPPCYDAPWSPCPTPAPMPAEE